VDAEGGPGPVGAVDGGGPLTGCHITLRDNERSTFNIQLSGMYSVDFISKIELQSPNIE
jgi:hypothetical protein